jgi:hypothetical protein
MSLAPIESNAPAVTPVEELAILGQEIRDINASASSAIGQRLLTADALDNETGKSLVQTGSERIKDGRGTGKAFKDARQWATAKVEDGGLGLSSAHVTNCLYAAKVTEITGVSVSTDYAKALNPLKKATDPALILSAWEEAKDEAVQEEVVAKAKELAAERGRQSGYAKGDVEQALETIDVASIQPSPDAVRKAAEQAAEQAGVQQETRGRRKRSPEEQFAAAFDRAIKSALAANMSLDTIEGLVAQSLEAMRLAEEVEAAAADAPEEGEAEAA